MLNYKNLVHEHRLDDFMDIIKHNKIKPKLLFFYLTETLKYLHRKGVNTSEIGVEEIQKGIQEELSKKSPSLFDYAVQHYLHNKEGQQ